MKMPTRSSGKGHMKQQNPSKMSLRAFCSWIGGASLSRGRSKLEPRVQGWVWLAATRGMWREG